MKPFQLLLFLSWALLSVVTATIFGDHEVFEIAPEVRPGWTQGDPAAADYTLNLSVILAQPRMREFEDHAINIATPGHPLYNQHLSREQIKSFLQPTNETTASVMKWFLAEGVSCNSVIDNGNWMTAKVKIVQAQRMLNTTFYQFHNGSRTIVRALQYSLPVDLHQHISLIQPTTRFAQIQPQLYFVKSGPTVSMPKDPFDFSAATCNETVTPTCLRSQYDVWNHTANYHPKNVLGISGFLDQYASYSDLSLFMENFNQYPPNPSFSVQAINGGLNVQGSVFDSREANLDMQYAAAMGLNSSIVFYTTAGRGQLLPDAEEPKQSANSNEPYLEQLQYLLNLPDNELPTVLSTSYSEDEQSVPLNYANVTCNMWAQLGARGVTVIFSSGDSGVGRSCQSNDGKNTTRFLPTFPASCPFVTSVGGTQSLQPEQAASFSSGGFSNYFVRPEYQDTAVGTYFQTLGNTWKGLYEPRGRGIPDLALRATDYYVFDHGELHTVSGTSCAAPAFAGFISILNSIRMDYKLSPLGFLNPFLYLYARNGFTDITLGGSDGCHGFDPVWGQKTQYVPYASWNATVGWDPVTGLGSADLGRIESLMVQYTFPAYLIQNLTFDGSD